MIAPAGRSFSSSPRGTLARHRFRKGTFSDAPGRLTAGSPRGTFRQEGGPDGQAQPANALSRLPQMLCFWRLLKPLRPHRPGPITALALPAHQLEKQINRVILVFKVMHLALTALADAPPAPCQAGFAEQCCRDFHGVIPGHVARGFGAFDINAVGLHDHAGIFEHLRARVQ